MNRPRVREAVAACCARMFRWLANHKRPAAAAGLALVVALLGSRLLVPSSSLGLALTRASYDGYYAWLGVADDAATDGPVVIVYLDLESYLSHRLDPAKPWPRDLHARLLDRLTKAGARAVVFDMVFDAPGTHIDSDLAFADAIRRNQRVILAAELGASSQRTGKAEWGRSTRLALPAEPFLRAAGGWGLSNLGVDEDFVARRYFVGRFHEGEPEPSLTWAAAQVLNLPPVRSPNAAAARWVRYYGRPFTVPHVGYRAALEAGAVDDEVFRDKFVFVGARPIAGLFQEHRDEFRSPFRSWHEPDLFMPGVEVHATQMLNLLRGDWLRRPSVALEGALVMVAALLAAALLWLRPVPAALATIALALLVVGGAVVAFRGASVWFPWLVPLAGQLPVALGGAVLFHSLEWHRTRRRLEAARREAERRIREQAALIDKAHDAIVVQDLSGRVLYANSSTTRLYGWSPQELKDGPASRLFPERDPDFAEARRVTFERGEWQGELHQRTRSGQPVAVESRWTLIRHETGEPKALLLINTDVTAERQLEAETLRMQRMEGIGAIAGGMAHDLNNALAPILLGTQILRRDTASEETQRVLALMEASARRGTEMVRQVLLFARGREGELQRLDLRPLIQEIEKLVRDSFPKRITVSAYLADDLWPVRGNATQLHQVLLNLCVNARDAMPGGGALALAADNADLGPDELHGLPGARPGAFVAVMVSDTGTGIPPDVLPRLFEPFFTTKPTGQGTGLGLSTASRIVKAHGGFIAVKPGAGGGTTFEILLPRLQPAAVAAVTPAAPAPQRGRGELVLVVDDEHAVREMLRRGLEDAGYRVLAASNGTDALSLFEAHAAEVALVLSDIAMPGMDGPSTLNALRALRPGLRYLWMSGEGGWPTWDAGARPSPGNHLEKPFELSELLPAVARVLKANVKPEEPGPSSAPADWHSAGPSDKPLPRK